MCRFSLAWLTLLHPSKPFDAMNISFMAVVFFPFGPCFGFSVLLFLHCSSIFCSFSVHLLLLCSLLSTFVIDLLWWLAYSCFSVVKRSAL